GRHLERAVIANGLDERALFRITGPDDGAIFATLEQGRQRIDPQTRLLFVRDVTGKAVLAQHGADARLEELCLGPRDRADLRLTRLRGHRSDNQRPAGYKGKHNSSVRHPLLPGWGQWRVQARDDRVIVAPAGRRSKDSRASRQAHMV